MAAQEQDVGNEARRGGGGYFRAEERLAATARL